MEHIKSQKHEFHWWLYKMEHSNSEKHALCNGARWRLPEHLFVTIVCNHCLWPSVQSSLLFFSYSQVGGRVGGCSGPIQWQQSDQQDINKRWSTRHQWEFKKSTRDQQEIHERSTREQREIKERSTRDPQENSEREQRETNKREEWENNKRTTRERTMSPLY